MSSVHAALRLVLEEVPALLDVSPQLAVGCSTECEARTFLRRLESFSAEPENRLDFDTMIVCSVFVTSHFFNRNWC